MKKAMIGNDWRGDEEGRVGGLEEEDGKRGLVKVRRPEIEERKRRNEEREKAKAKTGKGKSR